MSSTINVFVGYDSREDDAYKVCRGTLEETSSVPVRVVPLQNRELRRLGVYDRPFHKTPTGQMVDDRDFRPFSTEFTFTRFLTPMLARAVGLRGWVIFCDCDFMWRRGVDELMKLTDPTYALMCVKHNYKPPENIKMDNVAQVAYRRKNWSSLMLFNLDHASNLNLTVEDVNHRTGRWLHGMNWLNDDEIGGLSDEWNWLEGHSSQEVDPAAVHFTRGGPWFEDYENVAYADEWLKARARIEARARSEA